MLAHNSSAVNPIFEANLLSYHVYPRGENQSDVNLKLHNVGGLLVVYQPDHLDQLRKLGLDLTVGAHPNIKLVMISYSQTGGHLTFVSAHSNKLPVIKPMPGGEVRTARLMAFKSDDWCGTPTLLLKAFGESRFAEAAGTHQLDAIRALGLPIDAHQRGEWVYVPLDDGFTVQYNARKTGPNLEYITLERAVAPNTPSTPTDDAPGEMALLLVRCMVTGTTKRPTDDAPGEMALLPARAQSLMERITKQVGREFMKKWCSEHPYVDWFPTNRVIELPAVMKPIDPAILAILRGEDAPAATHPAPKTRRYPRRQPRQVVGETTYKYSSEHLVQLPRSERHKLMRTLDRMLDHELLPYLHGATDIGTVREFFDRFEDQLKAMKSVVSQARKADEAAKGVPIAAQLAASIRGDMSVYERQSADGFREREHKLAQILKDWLDLDLKVEGGVASLRKEGALVSFSLGGYLSTPSLQITLSSSLLTRHIRGSIFMHERAQDVYLGLWESYDKAVRQAEDHAARRETHKERRVRAFPFDRPQYLQ